ncbi:MAG: HD domain-containing protein [Clostridia bacterium]|nr:HD domain-containing protein [Clostridia bacterium]
MLEEYLSPYACKSSQAVRMKKESRKNEFNIRNDFSRDADRILHSTAYTRYIDKTQVFSLFNNDLITHRGLHVQFVAKIARTVGKALKLNEDLIEAIALGHDLGHVPFGHTGERFLSEICEENGLGYFLHNVQSVRVLEELENEGKGLNISIQVLDGILCHNGEFLCKRYVPNFNKTPEEFWSEYERCYIEKGFEKTIRPMTLEGCVVRICDVIAYIGRDIEDAIKVNLIEREDLPDLVVSVLGNTNSQIIDSLVEDLIANSYDKPYLEFSREKFNALKKLLDFNYRNIYSNPKKEDKEEKYRGLFISLFESLQEDLALKRGYIYENYLSEMKKGYTKDNSSDRIIVDFMAGMTDKFFINQYKEAFLPKMFNLTVDEK